MSTPASAHRPAPLAAVLIAATTTLAAELAVMVASRELLPSIEYLALGTAVTLGSALIVGGIGRLCRAPAPLALALWVGANGYVLQGPRAGIGFALITAALLPFDRIAKQSSLASGLAAALALCTAAVVWPLLGTQAGLYPAGSRWQQDVSMFVVLALTLLAQLAAGRIGRLPSSMRPTQAAVAALFVACAILPACTAMQRTPPRLPAYEATASSDEKPTILLLVLSTLRADHLSLHGYGRDTTPVLEARVEGEGGAVAYPLAFTTAPWTIPAHASLFTGEIPSTHGAHRLYGGERAGTFSLKQAVRADRMLGEVMRSRGYRTAGIFSGRKASVIRGLSRGFDYWVALPSPRPLRLLGEGLRARHFPWVLAEAVSPEATARQVNDAVLGFLDHCEPAPCFVVANYMDVHEPYGPAAPHAGRYSAGMGSRPPLGVSPDQSPETLRHAEARYDEEIRALDARIGELIGELGRRGILDRSWIFITADNGEAFGEDGVVGHGTGIENGQVRIPLIVKPPRGEAIVARRDAVDLLDVTATITSIAGAQPLGSGRDLRDPAAVQRPVQIEFFGRGPGFFIEPARTPARAVVVGREKLVERHGGYELFDLVDDPHERRDRSRESAERVVFLKEFLPPLVQSEPDPPEPLSPEEEETLRLLGYLE